MSDASVFCVFDGAVAEGEPFLLYSYPHESALIAAQSVWATVHSLTLSLTGHPLVTAALSHIVNGGPYFVSTRSDGRLTFALIGTSPQCDVVLAALSRVIRTFFGGDILDVVTSRAADVDALMAKWTDVPLTTMSATDVTLAEHSTAVHRLLRELSPAVITAAVYDSAASLISSLTHIRADWLTTEPVLISLLNTAHSDCTLLIRTSADQFGGDDDDASERTSLTESPHWIMLDGALTACHDRGCRICGDSVAQTVQFHVVRRGDYIITALAHVDGALAHAVPSTRPLQVRTDSLTGIIQTIDSALPSLERSAADIRLRIINTTDGQSVVLTTKSLSAALFAGIVDMHCRLCGSLTPLLIVRSLDDQTTLIGRSTAESHSQPALIGTDAASFDSRHDWMSLIQERCHVTRTLKAAITAES